MAKKFSYAHSNGSSHGLMVCSCCGQKITHGQYRYREGPKGFITHHRGCTPDDPEWERIAKAEEQSRRHQAAFVQACIEFRDKWGVDELDEIIATGE